MQRTIQTHTLHRTISKQSHVTPQRCFKWDKGNVKTRAGYGLFYSYISECTDADGQIMQPRFRRSLFSPPLFMYSAYASENSTVRSFSQLQLIYFIFKVLLSYLAFLLRQDVVRITVLTNPTKYLQYVPNLKFSFSNF